MNVSGSSPAPERTARLVHGMLLLGTVVVGSVVIVVGSRAFPVVSDALPRTLLRVVVLGLALFGTVALQIVRATVPAAPAQERAGWWATNAPRLVALWAVPEGVGIAGAVLAVIARDVVVATLVLGWAVVMLLVHAPGRVAEA
jgi:hypothetical protein